MKPIDKFTIIVTWSDEDQCYLAECQELYLVAHRDSRLQALSQIEVVMDEWVKFITDNKRDIPGQPKPVHPQNPHTIWTSDSYKDVSWFSWDNQPPGGYLLIGQESFASVYHSSNRSPRIGMYDRPFDANYYPGRRD